MHICTSPVSNYAERRLRAENHMTEWRCINAIQMLRANWNIPFFIYHLTYHILSILMINVTSISKIWIYPISIWSNLNNFHSLVVADLHPLQVENCGSNLRLVVDEDDNGKFRLERVQASLKRLAWPDEFFHNMNNGLGEKIIIYVHDTSIITRVEDNFTDWLILLINNSLRLLTILSIIILCIMYTFIIPKCTNNWLGMIKYSFDWQFCIDQYGGHFKD